MPEPDVKISLWISAAQNRELERIADESGRSKSDLIRDAISALIGMMSHAS